MRWKVIQEFPMLQQKMHGKPFIYLDSAATSQKPRCVIDAIAKFYSEEYATVHRSVYDFASLATERYNKVREQVRAFIGAAFAEEIVFTKGTTEAINLVASSFGKAFLVPGDEIIVTQMEHHSNFVPWQALCQEKGLIFKCVPIDDSGQLILEEYEKMLSDRTKLVCVAHISNVTGTMNPIEQIIAMAHAKGAKVLIDGAQSAGHLPIDVQALDVDFYAFSGHKMYGPTGIGVLYGKKTLLDRMPPYQYGGDMIDSVSVDYSVFQQAPLKFEAGTPMIAEVIGLGEALCFIESIGREEIWKWEHELLEYATSALKKIDGLRIIGTAPKKGGIISFVIDDLHALDIGTLLDMKGIAVRTGKLCAEPTLAHFGVPSLVRISFAVHTTHEEIDLLVEALREARLLLHPSMSF
ncbi:MAG: hypothetical protein RLZZ453_1007 [Chlamydiota bacterium]|jgi:cysteine desulfurase/selenocysteine lyase